MVFVLLSVFSDHEILGRRSQITLPAWCCHSYLSSDSAWIAMSTSTLTSDLQTFVIRPLDGQDQVYDDLPVDATVRDLKAKIFVAEGTPIENQTLIYNGEVMDGQSNLP